MKQSIPTIHTLSSSDHIEFACKFSVHFAFHMQLPVFYMHLLAFCKQSVENAKSFLADPTVYELSVLHHSEYVC